MTLNSITDFPDLLTHLPLHPNPQLQVSSDYSPKLSRHILARELDIAVSAAGDESFQLSSIELARSPLYILLERGSDLSYRKDLALVDVKAAPWILFGEQTHPVLYAAIAQRASDAGIDPPERHHVTSAEHAAQLAKSTG